MSDDETNEKLSIAGKMGEWPNRAIRMACRDRLGLQSPDVADALLEINAGELGDLAKDAERAGFGTEDLITSRLAHEYSTGEDLVRLVNAVYDAEYGDTNRDAERVQCPYEESANPKQCWSCTVPRQVHGKMVRQMKDERGRENEKE